MSKFTAFTPETARRLVRAMRKAEGGDAHRTNAGFQGEQRHRGGGGAPVPQYQNMMLGNAGGGVLGGFYIKAHTILE